MGGVIRRLPAWLRPDPLQTLGLVLIGSAVARTYRLRTPNQPVIFDETFYVNAARIILGIKVHTGLPYSGARPGFDPNEEHPVLGKVTLPNLPFRFSDCDTTVRTPAPLLGQDNRRIAASLGLSAEAVDAMVRDGVLYNEAAVQE